MGLVVVGVFMIIVIVIIHEYWWGNRKAIVPKWPILGMLPRLVCKFPCLHEYATHVLGQSGGTFEFKGPLFSGMDIIATSDPLNFQHITTTHFTNYPKGQASRDIFHDVLGDGIINSDFDLWKFQRRMFQLSTRQHTFNFHSFVAKSLHQNLLNHFLPFLHHATQTQIQVDLQEALQQMVTYDNAILLIFGLDLSSYKFKYSKAEYLEAFNEMEEVAIHRHILPKLYWKLQKLLQIGTEKRLRIARRKFDEFLFQCISLKREQMSLTNDDDDEVGNNNNLGLLAIYMKEKSFSNEFLKDVAINLLAAAKDTLTTGLSWFFWILATHPNIEAKILEEMKEKLGCNNNNNNNNGYYKIEELSKLVYLQATIYETFRLYPPVPFNHRTSIKEDVLPSGHHVKPNQMVFMSFYSSGRMEQVWEKDCLEFKPERWINCEQGNKFVFVPSHKFPSFYIGPRTCLGKDIALIQMKVLAVNVLKNYCFHVVEGHSVCPNLTFTFSMKYGLKIRVSKRCF
ncbi:hypothetical protein F8388_010440 [Cannabis sativa]|uniref:Cytochrome P450 n=1 Tax=Cannabis sativa TaxID=3483 RepID=A0A7J6GSH1_CANSA|nr:hypothetical protein F8388_010440 [Cannabis sativa]